MGPGINRSCSYFYDANQNITRILDFGLGKSYTYDSLNQLISARHNDEYYSYTYDNGGNILTKTVDGETISYGYNDPNWGDLLTSYDGQTIAYDTIGNSLSYRDGMSFSWNGRELASANLNGNNISYSYNADGVRAQKTITLKIRWASFFASSDFVFSSHSLLKTFLRGY